MLAIVDDLLVDGIAVQSILALMIWGAIVIQSMQGREPSAYLVAAGGAIMGFYFRSIASNAGINAKSDKPDQGA